MLKKRCKNNFLLEISNYFFWTFNRLSVILINSALILEWYEI